MFQCSFIFSVLEKLSNKYQSGGAASKNVVAKDASQRSGQSVQCEGGQLIDIENLKSEIVALELTVGRMLVENARRYENIRLRTISKRHVNNVRIQKKDQWLREAKSLSQYFITLKSNEAVVAQRLLMPYMPVLKIEQQVEPISHGRSMGAFRNFLNLFVRGRCNLKGAHHG